MTADLERLAELDKIYRQDLGVYCASLVKIKDKAGQETYLYLNHVQQYVDEKLRQQREATGRIRALILKGRQMGISTYVGGRYYHKTTMNFGQRTYILSHEDKTTQALFGMAKRIHEGMEPEFKPVATTDNANELDFSGIQSDYRVGTAKNVSGLGRGMTIQNFHGCLAEGSLVLDATTGHLKPIENFRVGDLVRTHTNKYAQVSFVSSQVKPCLAAKLKGLRDFPIVATREHRFWTKKGWAELGTLSENDKIGFPVRTINASVVDLKFSGEQSAPRAQGGGRQLVGPDRVPLTHSLGLVLGLYLAEGCIIRQHKAPRSMSAVTFAIHEKEAARTVEWLEQVKELNPDIYVSAKVAPRPDSKTVTVTAYGRWFAEFVRRWCGEKDTKHLPVGWSKMGEDFVRGVVHGYLSGDGHFSPDRDRRISATSVRPAITVGIRDALASLGYGWASIEFKPAGIRCGRNERAAYILRLTGEGVDRLSREVGKPCPTRKRNGAYGQVDVSGGYAWVPIVEITDDGQRNVFDLEIDDEDHSYCVLQGATHNSEVAWWLQAHVHFAGVMEAVPQMQGTEIILESTANGVGGTFYDQWDLAEKGKSEYIAIFLPWYWHHEYRQEPKDDFEPSPEEQEYAGFYDLEPDQVCWMHYKNIALGGKPGEICWQFRQEYPGYADEAFQTSGDESFIQPELVLKARKFTAPEQKYAARVMGVDVAYGGPDDTRLLDRCGQKMGGLVDEVMDTDDPMQIVGRVAHLIDQHKIQMTFVDATGGGGGVVPRLKELGYGSRVRGINFANHAHDQQLYKNKRAEMWGRMRDWLRDEAGADVPDNNIVQKHLCAPGYKEDSNGRTQLEEKRKIKKRLKFSPDWGDSACLTFAETVRQPIEHTPGWRDQMEREAAEPKRDWMTV